MAYLGRRGLLSSDRIFTHMTQDEKMLLYQVARKLRPGSLCAEIGSYLGASACFICGGLCGDGKLICIDTWNNDAMRYWEGDTDAAVRDTYREFRANTIRYRQKIVEVRKWSFDAVDDLKSLGQAIDFLFIDGDHAYEGVRKDWELYSPLLAEGALVAFHDTGWAEGVQRVVREFVMHRATLVHSLPNLHLYRLSGAVVSR
jgi:predicted O-methyltransferase YrrM